MRQTARKTDRQTEKACYAVQYLKANIRAVLCRVLLRIGRASDAICWRGGRRVQRGASEIQLPCRSPPSRCRVARFLPRHRAGQGDTLAHRHVSRLGRARFHLAINGGRRLMERIRFLYGIDCLF